MLYLVIGIAAVIAGVIQTVTGFGSGIFMMMFFPVFLPVLNASALSASITLIATAGVSWHYRKHIRFRLTVIPAVFYILASTAALFLAPYIPTGLMIKIFGMFLILLSVYFLCFPNKLEIKATLLSANICSVLSGFASGLFGIGGPPRVIYFLAATKDKEEYLGTIQFFFFITGVYTFLLRIQRGIYHAGLIPLTLLGMAAILIGKTVGEKIIDRIDGELMKRVIYVFLGLSGALNLFS